MAENSSVPRCFFRPRPIRVAFLVEDGEDADVTLDAVFANCHTRWGGRYSLVVPCDNRVPRSAWLPWVEVYDPDIIYAYIDLDQAAVTAMQEQFGPAFLTKHEPYDDRKRNKGNFRPRLPLECLTSLSVALQYARAHPQSAPQPMIVVDYLPGQPTDRFIDDNFGTLSGCFGWWPRPDYLADALQPITLASNKLLADQRRAHRQAGDTVPDTTALLRYMSERRNSFAVAQLAADSAPRIDVRDRHREAFTLIVGDTFADRVLFWNVRSLMPMYLGRHFTCLIVSPQRLKDEQFFDALVEFLKARNSTRQSQGTPWIDVTSVSQGTNDLASIRDRLRAADQWNGYHLSGPTPLDDAVPGVRAIEQIDGLSTGHAFDSCASWKEIPAEGNELRTPPTLPHHLEGAQSQSRATVGAWGLDLDIERQNNLTRYSNVSHRWRLPRRLRMHGAFCQPYEGFPDRRLRYPRSTREGFLSLFTGFGEEPPPISLPDDESAFRFALKGGRDWPPVSHAEHGTGPSGPYSWSRPSDKGRYLIGVLRRFGGLQKCGSVLLHRYWKTIFDELGAAVSAERHDAIKLTLKKKLRTERIDSEDAWDRLAKLVAHEAHRVRMPSRVLSFEILRAQHESFVEKERKELEEHRTKSPDEWIADARASLQRSTRWLCAHSVLYQGYEQRCRTCYHANWIHVSALEPVSACEVCGTRQIAPVDRSWDFRLDGFLREALKEHGLLALVWCLIKLESRVRETFYFLGPQDLFIEYPKNNRVTADNEIDLICVLDGEVHLCEVKSSSRGIQVQPLVNVAKRIRPDVVTLAVLEVESPRLTKKLNELRAELEDDKVAVELLTLADDDFSDHAYLPA